MTMLVIGLVGRIGAGKSTVARLLADRGARVVDADALAHAALDEPEVIREVVARFGADVADGSGRLRRSALAARVFGPDPAHAEALRDLEAIVHPRVRSRILAELTACREAATPGGVVVLDVPLLVQAGWEKQCDLVLEIDCEDRVRHRRLEARGWTAAEIAARDSAWERRFVVPGAACRVVRVDTSGDPAYTLNQVDRIWNGLRLPPPAGR
jgi:dephospho-CoA kinase